MNTLQSRNLVVGYDQQIVIPDLSTSFPAGKITAIVGANGCGKSTVLKAFSRVLRPIAGAVLLDRDEIRGMRSNVLAQRLSILPQTAHAPDSLTVRELVSYGRYPHRRWLGGASPEDAPMVQWAIRVTGIEPLADRPVNALSGGQRQRAWIAMTLAQGADVLLLDEPTSHLDTCHQLEVMELLARLNRDEGKTVVLVLHDLNLAARYADHMLAIKEGQIAAAGPPREVMTKANLRSLFGIHAIVMADPLTGSPMCIAYPASSAPTHGTADARVGRGRETLGA